MGEKDKLEQELTADMVDAGVYAIRDFHLGDDLREVVARVFWVMQSAKSGDEFSGIRHKTFVVGEGQVRQIEE